MGGIDTGSSDPDRLSELATLGETEREAICGNLRRAHKYRPKETGMLLAALKTVAPPCAELRVDVPDACTPAPGVPGGTATRERLPG